MISTRQAQALRLQCTKTLGMSEGEYKAMLSGYKVTSSKQLAPREYNALMRSLKGPRQGQQREWAPKADKQMGLIFHLWSELHKCGKVQHKGNKPALHWMAKYLRQPDGTIEFTPYQKSRCIERLKKWLERE